MVFLDHHNTQRGEAQLTYKNGGFKQLASLSPPTSVTELQRNLPTSRFQLSTIRLHLCLPASHTITVDQCLERVVEVRV